VVDAVVVGGGMGGLAAAISLATAGNAVVLLEAAPTLGGKAGTATVDGVTFDTGPSVLTLPQGIGELFASAGEDWSEHVTLRLLERPFRYVWPDGAALDVAATLDGTLENVRAAWGAEARDELASFLRYARTIWDAVAPTFVFGPAPTVAGLVAQGPRGWRSALRIDAFRTMDQAVRARVREPHLHDLLLRYATYNGSDPRKAPATLHCIAYVELGLGGFGVDGGMRALVAALVALAQRLGVELRVGEAVSAIDTRAGVVHGVRLADGRAIPARTVIVNADARALRGTLLPSPSPDAHPRTPSMSAWTAVARARRQPARAAHTVFFPLRYEQEFEDIFERHRMPIDPTVYCCAQEPAHGIRGWADDEPVFVMVNAPSADRAVLPASFAETIRRRLVDADFLTERDGFVWERTPEDLAQRFPASEGSLYGAASHGWSAAFRRPPNRVEGVAGLYLASGSAHPGGGVPLAIQSGREAARLALRDRPRRDSAR
jgi:1-hydroxycarotenoid 3,4-desaturase